MAKAVVQNDPFDHTQLVIHPVILSSATTRYQAEVFINEEPISWLAQTIENAISDTSFRDPKPIEFEVNGKKVTSIAQAFILSTKVALGARIYQVSGLPTQFDKKNFEYVALLSSILGSYGVYHNSEEAYDIVPVLGSKLKGELQEMGCFSTSGAFIVPAWYADVMSMFRRYHLMTGYGLIRETTIDDASIFKISVDQNVVVGRHAVGVREVLIACLVSSSKLTDLFGAYRTLYTGLATVRTTIENIGLKALHDLG